jgi:hypothetical protein
MGLKRVFVKGAALTFKIFKEAVKDGYLVVVDDTGFDDATETTYPVRVIADSFTKEDAEQSSFYDLVQPTDVKGLILGEEISVEIKTVDLIRIDDVDYSIVEYDTDPYGVLYTLLLRASK